MGLRNEDDGRLVDSRPQLRTCVTADMSRQTSFHLRHRSYTCPVPSPLVSVVVPSRGGANRLPILMEALAQQEIDEEWEVVVVLDGDIDDSRSIVELYADRLPVRHVAFSENRGRSAALNAGFDEASGRVLIRCDDDLVPAPDYLTRHAQAHGGHPVGVVGLYRNVFPETTYSRVYGMVWDRQFRDEAYKVGPHETWRYWAGNCSVTRSTYDRVGPYDTDFRAYGFEDVDWGYRLSLADIPVVLDPGLETEHRIAATTTAIRAQRAFYSGAARQRFDQKHDVAKSVTSAGAWDNLVSRVAARLDERRSLRFGAAIDRLGRVLPAPVARKAVALAVEASSRSGQQHGTTRGSI